MDCKTSNNFIAVQFLLSCVIVVCGVMMLNIFLTVNGVKDLWKPQDGIALGSFIWHKEKNNSQRDFPPKGMKSSSQIGAVEIVPEVSQSKYC